MNCPSFLLSQSYVKDGPTEIHKCSHECLDLSDSERHAAAPLWGSQTSHFLVELPLPPPSLVPEGHFRTLPATSERLRQSYHTITLLVWSSRA